MIFFKKKKENIICFFTILFCTKMILKFSVFSFKKLKLKKNEISLQETNDLMLYSAKRNFFCYKWDRMKEINLVTKRNEIWIYDLSWIRSQAKRINSKIISALDLKESL